MAGKGKHLANKRENKKDLHPHRNVALERSKRAEAYSRTDERNLGEAYGARCRCHHSPDGSESLED